MKKWILGLLAVVGLALVGTAVYAQQIFVNADVFKNYIYYSSNMSHAMFTAAHPGMYRVDITAGSVPNPQLYDQTTAAWLDFTFLDVAETITSAWTFSATATFNGNTVVGSDEEDLLTVNAPTTNVIFRDDFNVFTVYQSDLTAESGVDTELNWIATPWAPGGHYIQRVEQTATLTLANYVTGGPGLDVSGDITNNDGHEIVFGETLGGYGVIGTTPYYFEISVTIGDISAFDGDWALGLRQPEALQDPPQHDGLNTYSIFTLSDNAGDLDVECDLDAGGEVNDDTGTTWADGQTKVLRIEIITTDIEFFVDGVEVTATNCNATGANDWSAGDKILPFYYHTQGAEGAATGVVINYIEWGEGTLD